MNCINSTEAAEKHYLHERSIAPAALSSSKADDVDGFVSKALRSHSLVDSNPRHTHIGGTYSVLAEAVMDLK